jgi:hypothetical protein
VARSPPAREASDDEVVRMMSGRVAGKVAPMTGAARGQGRAGSMRRGIAPDAGVTEF